MSRIIEVIEKLPDLIILKPVGTKAIENIEIELALRFAEEYKEYLQKFGAVMADNVELTGAAKSKSRNVVSVTKREWGANPLIQHTMYVVENVGIDGIIIWQDVSGSIYQSKPNHPADKIADSLADYLEEKL